jgi:hypothetical protein
MENILTFNKFTSTNVNEAKLQGEVKPGKIKEFISDYISDLNLNEGTSVNFTDVPKDIIDSLKKIRAEKVINNKQKNIKYSSKNDEIVNYTLEITGDFRSFSTDELYILTENRRFLKMIIEKNAVVLIFQLNKNEI